LGLPEKKNCFKLTGSISPFVPIIVFLTILCTQINSASAVTNVAVPGDGAVSITDFFSDQNLSDATVRFEQPLENVSLVFTLSSENKILKSETFLLDHVEKGQEITKVLFWGLKENFGKDRESYKAQLFVKNGSEILDSRNFDEDKMGMTGKQILGVPPEKSSVALYPVELKSCRFLNSGDSYQVVVGSNIKREYQLQTGNKFKIHENTLP